MKYIDYGSMQSEAQRRVADMQRRSSEAVRGTPITAEMPPPVQPTASDKKLPGPTAEKHIENEKKPDAEKTLILMLLVLLVSEKADISVILALLYLLL